MKCPPPAVRESMEAARGAREWAQASLQVNRETAWFRNGITEARRTTREILRALRALRRQEVALIGRIGVK